MPSGPNIRVPGLKTLSAGKEVLIFVRPEEFMTVEEGQGMEATVKVKRFLGKYVQYIMDCGLESTVEVTADTSSTAHILEEGEKVWLGVNTRRINIFDSETETTLVEGVVSNV